MVLDRCMESNITISLKKMQVGESVVLQDTTFLGKVSNLLLKELQPSTTSLPLLTPRNSKVSLDSQINWATLYLTSPTLSMLSKNF